MKLSEALQKKLSGHFEPAVMIDMRFKGNDVSFKTDEEGNPVLLFIGTRNKEGTIKGDRFVRTLKKDKDGKILKDHWEQKGRAS